MADHEFDEAVRALEALEEEQKARFRPEEPAAEPRTEAEWLAKQLAAAQSPWRSGPGLLG
jgi:hypothetical protein